MLDQRDLARARGDLIEVAERHGGVYDGWGAFVNADD